MCGRLRTSGMVMTAGWRHEPTQRPGMEARHEARGPGDDAVFVCAVWRLAYSVKGMIEYYGESLKTSLGAFVDDMRELAELRKETRWRRVEDELPERGKVVLACGPVGHVFPAFLSHKEDQWYMSPSMTKVIGRTHWRPLPEPRRRKRNEKHLRTTAGRGGRSKAMEGITPTLRGNEEPEGPQCGTVCAG